MAKVIYVDDNGNQEVLREGNIYKGDVLFRDDYFATKLWCEEDVEMLMENLGYKVTPERVADVINHGGNWSGLTDCTDGEWTCIEEEIRMTLGASM